MESFWCKSSRATTDVKDGACVARRSECSDDRRRIYDHSQCMHQFTLDEGYMPEYLQNGCEGCLKSGHVWVKDTAVTPTIRPSSPAASRSDPSHYGPCLPKAAASALWADGTFARLAAQCPKARIIPSRHFPAGYQSVPGFAKPLAAGSFGEVWIALEKTSRRFRAIKFFFYSSMREKVEKGLEALAECENCKKLSAKSFVTCYKHGCSALNAASGQPAGFCYVIEDFSGVETLEKFIQYLHAAPRSSRDTPLVVVDDAIAVLTHLTEALAHLEAAKQVHHDIKPANIMVNAQHGSNLRLQLVDMGSLTECKAGADDIPYTPLYAAPETWSFDHNYCSSFDTYSSGLTVMEVLTGSPLYDELDGVTSAAALFDFLRVRFPSKTAILEMARDTNLIEALFHMLRAKPEDRVTPAEIQAALPSLCTPLAVVGGRTGVVAPEDNVVPVERRFRRDIVMEPLLVSSKKAKSSESTEEVEEPEAEDDSPISPSATFIVHAPSDTPSATVIVHDMEADEEPLTAGTVQTEMEEDNEEPEEDVPPSASGTFIVHRATETADSDPVDPSSTSVVREDVDVGSEEERVAQWMAAVHESLTPPPPTCAPPRDASRFTPSESRPRRAPLKKMRWAAEPDSRT
eukprot:GILK01002907.1.p1 GENE.GILK01002907.1~~GILK01002907.1.p1  ORF type:complete len:726 (+),score=67.46 GILK01002907.1:287-2179(+)